MKYYPKFYTCSKLYQSSSTNLFSHLNKIISDFIWNKKPPHIPRNFYKDPDLLVGWPYLISNYSIGQELGLIGFKLMLTIRPLLDSKWRLIQASHYPSQLSCIRQCPPRLPPGLSGGRRGLKCENSSAGSLARFVPQSWQIISCPSLEHDSF